VRLGVAVPAEHDVLHAQEQPWLPTSSGPTGLSTSTSTVPQL
jgi:hypothetical protein